jgi:hypothetical protein
MLASWRCHHVPADLTSIYTPVTLTGFPRYPVSPIVTLCAFGRSDIGAAKN